MGEARQEHKAQSQKQDQEKNPSTGRGPEHRQQSAVVMDSARFQQVSGREEGLVCKQGWEDKRPGSHEDPGKDELCEGQQRGRESPELSSCRGTSSHVIQGTGNKLLLWARTCARDQGSPNAEKHCPWGTDRHRRNCVLVGGSITTDARCKRLSSVPPMPWVRIISSG